jgi:cytochrome c5
MKPLHVTLITVAIFGLTYCKSKKTTITETTTDKTPVVGAKTLAELQLEIVQSRWPNTLAEELSTGQTIYTTKCTECHKAHTIEKFNEKKWLHEIDDMSPKANLTADEKLKLTKYILSYRDTKERLKNQQ